MKQALQKVKKSPILKWYGIKRLKKRGKTPV